MPSTASCTIKPNNIDTPLAVVWKLRRSIFFCQSLTLKKMMQHGLKWAPQGAINLSDEKYKKLLLHIESIF